MRKKYSPSQDIIFILPMPLTNIRLVKSHYHTSQWIERKASYMILSWVDWRNALSLIWLHSLLPSRPSLGQNRKPQSDHFMINRFQEQAILQSSLRQQYKQVCLKPMGSFKIKSKCQAEKCIFLTLLWKDAPGRNSANKTCWKYERSCRLISSGTLTQACSNTSINEEDVFQWHTYSSDIS